jgi:dynein heavy chain
MFFQTQNVEVMLQKQVNFSSATVPKAFQDAIEADLEKRGGKNYGPPLGKRMTVKRTRRPFFRPPINRKP